MQPPTGLALDDATLAELYQRYAHTLLAFIRRYASTREDAEDVLLDVFLAASEQRVLANMSEGEQLAWLRRVAHHKCVDAYRRARLRPALSLEEIVDQAYDDEERGPEQLALRAEEHALLRDHLAYLPEAQQEILRLRFANGLRCVEIARMYNKREGTVRMLLARPEPLTRSLRATSGRRRESMSEHNEPFLPERVDEQIDALTWPVAQPTPRARLISNLRAAYSEDTEIVEQVRVRLARQLAAGRQSGAGEGNAPRVLPANQRKGPQPRPTFPPEQPGEPVAAPEASVGATFTKQNNWEPRTRGSLERSERSGRFRKKTRAIAQ